jgi:putative transposase
MPWSSTSPMDQRVRFIADYQRRFFSLTELCRRFEVSRKTAYKWIERYEAEGASGLKDQSRRPHHCPHQTPTVVVQAILDFRRRHPTWGPKKILRVLSRRLPSWNWPSRSTCGDLLSRHGLVTARKRRSIPSHPGRPLTPMDEPNSIWTADFKGQFKTRDRRYVYPLTVVDGCSRFLLACQGLRSTAVQLSKPVFRRLFEEYGLPLIIRTDNGVPFATTALARLSELSVWWIRLGIYPELIEPAHPEQNGRHERMHRTLKAETTRPPCGNIRAQQVRFNRFRQEYNEDRPHEGLDQETPASAYRASPRKLPRELPRIEYPGHFEVRRVSTNSMIRWKSGRICVTHTLAGQHIGLEEVDDGRWDVYFGPLKLGRMDERRLQIEDDRGRWVRQQVLPMSPD